MKKIPVFIWSILLHSALIAQPQLIPQPQVMEYESQAPFEWKPSTLLGFDPQFEQEAKMLKENLRNRYHVEVPLKANSSPESNCIVMQYTSEQSWADKGKKMYRPEEYEITIKGDVIVMKAHTTLGMKRAVATLYQLIPTRATFSWPLQLPCVFVHDYPKFDHRGLLLDCGRHFMSVDFITQTLDAMALYKLNVFHWHLTEDQGWRIEIKKYPKLTQIGAYRMVNGKPYGGYYTQAQIKYIVDYASQLGITVIPEIELPGHSSAAIASYPELSCTGKQIPVETEWGVFKDIYCAGNDKTMQFIKDVMDEVCALFPGQFIHIGGDEAPKARWEECKSCQKRMHDHHLKNEAELQTWMINDVAAYLQTKGKRVIGWDEILEGGIPSTAAIQSWRGMAGGVTAARAGHDVVMSPTSHCYIDYGLDAIDTKRVYEFNPVPNELEIPFRIHILGAEANMWTEHAPQEEAQQKIFPRLIALGEVLWTYPSKKDYVDFEKRLRSQFPMMDAWGIKYGFISTPVRVDATAADGRLYAEVKKEDPLVNASYKLISTNTSSSNKTEATWEKINGPIEIKGNQELVVQVQTQGSQQVNYIHRNYSNHLALGKYIELNYKINSNYPGGGDYGLVDGRLGTENFRDGIWQAVQGQDMEMVIDLGSLVSFNRISTRWFHYSNAWIFRPETVSYFASVDGNHWTLLKDVKADIAINAGGEAAHASVCEQAYPAYIGRYVKVVAKTIGKCPAWHDAAGEPSWLFCDEIIVE